GDTLVVTRVDRSARSIGDSQDVVRASKAKGVALRATEQPIDTSTAAGKAFLDMSGLFAEFETNSRRERQMEGIAAAKARGVYKGKGRKPTIDAAEVQRLHAEGRLGPAAIAKRSDRIVRVLERLERNDTVTSETIASFIRFWSTSTPASPEQSSPAARAKGAERYDRFVEALGRRLSSGSTMSKEVSIE
ncbi:hypothetical protein OY671_008006, partial [Metschnikowia pulcherrima]